VGASRHLVEGRRRLSGVRVEVVGGLWWMIQADAGHASEGEKVGFIRVGAGADKAGDPSGNAPFVEPMCFPRSGRGYGTKDGVAGRIR